MACRFRKLVLLSSISLPLCAQAGIPLRQGVYVLAGTKCAEAPFAAMKMWNGVGFNDPHDTHCVAKILKKAGHTYKVDNTCSALGDGTPTTPDTEHATVVLLSPQSFRYVRQVPGGLDAATYRWCSEK